MGGDKTSGAGGRATGRPGRRVVRRPARRRGIALLLVLIILSFGCLLTMHFLQTASARSELGMTLAESKKAEFLAESGMSEASYWLRHPELTNGVAWTGVQGRLLDTSPDFYNVKVTQKPSDLTCYTVSSEGHRVDGAGNDTTRTVTADFRMYQGFAEAITTPYDLTVPSGATVLGNVYAYNKLDNRGRIDGSVWVGLTFLNSGTITGLTNLNTPSRNIGSYPMNTMIFYTYSGQSYMEDTILAMSTTNQTWGASTSNPVGLWYRGANLTLNGTTTVNGTLYVLGNLTLAAGSQTVMTSKGNIPALCVKGNLTLAGDGINATINGAVIVQGRIIAAGSMPSTKVTINGPLVFTGATGGFDPAFSADAKVVINHDPARADVSGFYTTQPRTLAGARLINYRADGS